MNYWVICITKNNLKIVFERKVLGFKESRIGRVKKFSPGDLVIFYVSRMTLADNRAVQKFMGIAKITSRAYESDTPVWKDGLYPVRIDLKPVTNRSCDIRPLIHTLSFIKNKEHWGGTFMSALLKIQAKDFEIIKNAMSNAEHQKS